jgi:chitodextrinase
MKRIISLMVVAALTVIAACGPADDPFTIKDSIPPSTPTGLVATPVGISSISLTWNASSDDWGVAGYKIYRGGVYLKTASGTTASDTGLSAATTYCYTVSATDFGSNESAQSNQVCATTLAN